MQICSKKRSIINTPLLLCLFKGYFDFAGHIGYSFKICAATINRLGHIFVGLNDPKEHVAIVYAADVRLLKGIL